MLYLYHSNVVLLQYFRRYFHGYDSYALINLITGKFKEKKIRILIYILAALSILKYIFL